MNSVPSSSRRRPLRVGLISLGCAKNLVDAEIMLGSLLKGGIEITNDPAQADAVIVNTCSFIDAAQEESVDTILESAEARDAKNRGQALIVSGCLSQRFRDQLPVLFPEVDAFMGIDEVARVASVVTDAIQRRADRQGAPGPKGSRVKIASGIQLGSAAVESDASSLRGTPKFNKTKTIVAPPVEAKVDVTSRPTYIPDFETPRFRLTPKHFAYVKIAEGCNHPCSFCIIPRMRGSHRSRPQSDVAREARMLLKEGVKELNLISQDSTYYGLDLRPERVGSIASPARFSAAAKALPAGATTLATLLRELNELPGAFWVRLLYTHPAHWTDELIQTIRECRKVVRYVDMPLQHIHDAMLERMRRETSREYIVDLIRRIRAGVPGIAIRTTFIVGFPGETEEYFESLLEFIRETRFERLGIFAYSREEGTRAGNMEGQIPEKVKQKRRQRAMAEQLKVAQAAGRATLGKELTVLTERPASGVDLDSANVQSWEHGLLRDGGVREVPVSGRYTVARGEADGPDIDGRVYVKGNIEAGRLMKVRVVGSTDYDLIAEAARD